jgi:GGDEF domain-containing protein
VNKPQSLNIFLFPSSETTELGSVEAPPVLRIMRPLSFALWLIVFCVQMLAVVSGGESVSWLLIGLSTALFAGVHMQYWYEDSEQGRRFHHAVERMRGRIYEDEQTGLPNSRHFVFELRRQMMRSVRNGRGFALVLTDVIGWESVGAHEREFLHQATRSLRQSLGDGDFLGRLQGPVFAAIVLDERDNSAAEKADSLITAIGSAVPLDLATSLQPVISVTGYQGELEVRDFLRRGQRDLAENRARGAGPIYKDPERVLRKAS